ncbi:MAG TPA: hypothetical protein VGN31_00290 [Paraburkholderia sp.]
MITFAVSTGTAASAGGGFLPEQATKATAKINAKTARAKRGNEKRFGMDVIMDECQFSAAQHGVKTCESSAGT